MADSDSGGSDAKDARPPPPRPPPPAPSLLGQLREAPVTAALFAVCIAVFVAAERTGSTTRSETLVAWGATWRWAVWRGEWWRLFTSMFLHIGVVHLGWNLFAGFGWCRPVERHLGAGRFLALYLLSGVVGAAASVLGHDAVSAGASGALFGVIGVVFAADRAASGSWRATLLERQARNAGMVALWFVVGAGAGFDNWAHLGGLATGLVLGTLWLGGAPRPMKAALAACLLLVPLSLRPWSSEDSLRLAAARIQEAESRERWADVLREVARAPEPLANEGWVLDVRIRALAALGRPNEGVALAKAFVTDAPTSEPYLRLAVAYQLAGRLDAGLGAADVAVSLNPSDISARRARAFLRVERGDHAGCAEDLERLASLEPLVEEERTALQRCRSLAGLGADAGAP